MIVNSRGNSMDASDYEMIDVIRQLRQMQQYNITIAEDETFDKIADACEKQVAKKVIKARNSLGMTYFLCPRCRSFRVFGNCCTDCRQKISR